MASEQGDLGELRSQVPPAPESPEPQAEDDEADFEEMFRTPFRRPGVASLRNILATVLVGVAILGIVWFFDRPGTANSQSITLTADATGPAPKIDKEAPAFSIRTLDGQEVNLSDYRGQPVWLNFWASWCPPCRAENPDIEEMYQKYKDQGLVILAISIGEGASDVSGYIKRTNLSFTVALDETTEVAARYRIVGIPTHYFIDGEGILRSWRIGSMSTKTMEKRIQEILPSSGQDGSSDSD